MSFDIDLGNFMISLFQSMLALGIQTLHLLLEKKNKFFENRKDSFKTAQYCSAARVETIFGDLCETNCLW